MKKRRILILSLASLAVLILIVFLILLLIRPSESNLDRANRFALRYKDVPWLNASFSNLPVSYYTPYDPFWKQTENMPEAIRLMFMKEKDLILIKIRSADEVTFDFSSFYSPEEDWGILFQKQDIFDMDYLIPYDAEWKVESKDDEILAYGGGANGKGYVFMRRIIPQWFFIASYLPT